MLSSFGLYWAASACRHARYSDCHCHCRAILPSIAPISHAAPPSPAAFRDAPPSKVINRTRLRFSSHFTLASRRHSTGVFDVDVQCVSPLHAGCGLRRQSCRRNHHRRRTGLARWQRRRAGGRINRSNRYRLRAHARCACGIPARGLRPRPGGGTATRVAFFSRDVPRKPRQTGVSSHFYGEIRHFPWPPRPEVSYISPE